MKMALRVLALFLVLGGIFMIFCADSIKENNAPREVRINDRVIGYQGGNEKTDSEMNALTGIGVVVSVIGVIVFIISLKVKQNQANY